MKGIIISRSNVRLFGSTENISMMTGTAVHLDTLEIKRRCETAVISLLRTISYQGQLQPKFRTSDQLGKKGSLVVGSQSAAHTITRDFHSRPTTAIRDSLCEATVAGATSALTRGRH
jgi:hypothetical protein